MGKLRVLVLGAGFGGLEATTLLSDALGADLDLILIDRSDTFYFGYSKLDVMFGRKPADAVKIPYAQIVKPGVRFVQASITAIDPHAKRVTTDKGVFDADYLVVALGADYAPEKTPGLVEGGCEYYSFAGALRVREVLPKFTEGHAIVGVCGPSFKCPPAPSEAALLLHDDLVARGVRDACTVSLVMPFAIPIPPSPDISRALLEAFAERGIEYVKDNMVKALDSARHVVKLSDGRELPCDLLLAIPQHRVPDVVETSGLAVDGWIPVDKHTLETRFPGVYAVGDVTSVGTAKSGGFAETQAMVVAAEIIARYRGEPMPAGYDGTSGCYVEFGAGRIGRVDVDFFSGPQPRGTFRKATVEMAQEKIEFGSVRRARWFNL